MVKNLHCIAAIRVFERIQCLEKVAESYIHLAAFANQLQPFMSSIIGILHTNYPWDYLELIKLMESLSHNRLTVLFVNELRRFGLVSLINVLQVLGIPHDENNLNEESLEASWEAFSRSRMVRSASQSRDFVQS